MNQLRSQAGISRTLLMVAIASLIALVSVAVVTVRNVGSQNGDELIHACASSSNVRIVESSDDCRGNETHVSWNAQGPEGPAGPSGPPGSTDVNINVNEEGPAVGRGSAFVQFELVDGTIVKGETEATGLENWSYLLSFQHGFHATPSSGGGSGGVLQLTDAVLVKDIDAATATLVETAATGQSFDTVHVAFTKVVGSGQSKTYLRYEMKDVVISSYNASGTGGADTAPTESMTLSPREVLVEYTTFDESGETDTVHSYSINLE